MVSSRIVLKVDLLKPIHDVIYLFDVSSEKLEVKDRKSVV